MTKFMIALVSAMGAVIVVMALEHAALDRQITACLSDKVDAEFTAATLRAGLEAQNQRVREAHEQSEHMRAIGDAARAEARQAAAETDKAIARLRREHAHTQSCEEVRQLLIGEVAGHVF